MAPIHILLVEDNPGDIRLTQEALQEGCVCNTLAVATTGESALELLRNGAARATEARGIDLVLLDINLPGLSGLEVLREIKNDPSLCRIPIVMLTSSQAEEDIVRAYDQHANCFITKPVDLDAFFEIIRSIERFWVSIVQLPGTRE